MKYIQNNISFAYQQSLQNSDEWYATISYQGVEIEIIINASYFIDDIIIWERAENITQHLLNDFEFIYKISKRWAVRLYNGYGNKLEEVDQFGTDGCEFANLLIVQLDKPTLRHSDGHNDITFLVNNVFDSEFTYLDSSCLFTIFTSTYFVGVIARNIQ